MDRTALESFTDLPTSGFGIVTDFDPQTLGDEFLNDINSDDSKTPPAKAEKEEKEDKEIPAPITLENEDPAELGNSLLDGIGTEEDDEEGEESDKENPLLKDTPKKEEKKTEKKDEAVKEGDETPFQIIANQLLDSGLFSLDEDEDTLEISTGEELLERFQYEKNKQAHDTLYEFLAAKHGDEGIEVFDAIFQKGVPIKDYLQKYQEAESLAELDLEGEDNEHNQRLIMQRVYESQGFEQSDIDAEITKLKNYGDLEETAKRYHKPVIKREQEKLKKIEQDAAEKEELSRRRTQHHNNSINQILAQKLKDRQFDGIPVTEKISKETYERLTAPAYKMPDGSIGTAFDAYLFSLNHPDNYQEKVKLALLVELMKKDPSFETIKKKGVSEKSDVLFSKLATQEKRVKHNHPINTPSKGFLDGL